MPIFLNIIGKDFSKLVKVQDLPVDFLDEYMMDLLPFKPELYQQLPEWLINKYADKLNWQIMSKTQTLSESLIEKYWKFVNWKHIKEFQQLSPEFKHKWQNFLK